MAGELESDSVALERIREYEELPQEAEWDTPPGLDRDWPQAGRIQFSGYSARYRPELPLVIADMELSMDSSEKVGVVGRTGAGKSSLTLALFRIIEPAAGSIVIDGRDIATVGLQDLRSRLTIIPQDPTLFSGTVRFNLDPGDEFSEGEVEAAVQSSGLGPVVAGLEGGLHHPLDEGGKGLSLGQRQLVCLARALLRRSRILVLDEATAAVDTATDDKIQQTIRTEFRECTVMTIAHRLNTVLGGHTVIVMDKGAILEKGSPADLIKDVNSRFYKMSAAAGIVDN